MVSRRKLLGMAVPATLSLPVMTLAGQFQSTYNSYTSVESLKVEPAKEGDIVYLHSYHEGKRIGGGFLVHSLEDIANANMVTSYPSANGVWSRILDRSGAVDCSFAGMIPDGNYDNTDCHNTLINFADAAGFDIFYGSGIYLHKGIVIKNASPSCPNLYGCGGIHKDKGTIFQFANEKYLKIKGGSGILCLSSITGVKFVGDGSNNGLLVIADQCGVNIDRCMFDKCSIGLRMINEGLGGFTEFNVANDCVFSSSCKTGFSYERENGNESFHGTGLVSCVFQQHKQDDSQPHIIIGTNCLVYNSPMSIQIFKGYSASTIIRHDGSKRSNVYGVITIEKKVNNLLELVSGNTLYIVGSVICLSENLLTTNAIFCSRFQANSDGSVNYLRNSVSLSGTFNNENENEVIKFNSGESAFIDLSIVSGSQIERKLVFVAVDRDGNGLIKDTTISPIKSEITHEELIYFKRAKLIVKRINNDTHQWIADVSFIASRFQHAFQ
ncbi:hypothetical protein [Serratia fonticola]